MPPTKECQLIFNQSETGTVHTAIGDLSGYLKQHMVLHIPIDRARVLYGAIGMRACNVGRHCESRVGESRLRCRPTICEAIERGNV